jgi:AraC family transcriptional regulator of adaptative response/methylated-DNA-[protein]-cysteine methyltransferase
MENAGSQLYETSDAVMIPSAFGRAATVISYAIEDCSFGFVLVAATTKGVCAIFLGDDPRALADDLQKRFPEAVLTGGDADFERLVADVIGSIEAPGLAVDLPLDVQGTAFQRHIWQALRAIPLGETASYADIARAIGAPKSVRAVAGACAANSIAIVIPCHRVVKTDGGLSGYRWGVARKRALLEREKAVSAAKMTKVPKQFA